MGQTVTFSLHQVSYQRYVSTSDVLLHPRNEKSEKNVCKMVLDK